MIISYISKILQNYIQKTHTWFFFRHSSREDLRMNVNCYWCWWMILHITGKWSAKLSFNCSDMPGEMDEFISPIRWYGSTQKYQIYQIIKMLELNSAVNILMVSLFLVPNIEVWISSYCLLSFFSPDCSL